MHKLLGLSLVVAAAAMPQPKPSAVVAFTNVSVLPMDRETVLSGQTVVIRDGKIAELGAAAAVRVPDGAVSVDGQGKFLMPTLAEGTKAEHTLMFVQNFYDELRRRVPVGK